MPQGTTDVDLAGRIEADLVARLGDGWRFADLPDDVGAWRAGLDTLIARDGDFAVLSDAGRDAVLHDVAGGQVGSSPAGLLTPERITLWFEDVRATAARAWISPPEVMAHIGYDGFANGGDGVHKQGYLRVGAGEREPWQTLPLLAVRAHADQEGEARGWSRCRPTPPRKSLTWWSSAQAPAGRPSWPA